MLATARRQFVETHIRPMVCQYHTRKDTIVRQRHAHKRDAAEWLAGGGLEDSNQGFCDAGMMMPGWQA